MHNYASALNRRTNYSRHDNKTVKSLLYVKKTIQLFFHPSGGRRTALFSLLTVSGGQISRKPVDPVRMPTGRSAADTGVVFVRPSVKSLTGDDKQNVCESDDRYNRNGITRRLFVAKAVSVWRFKTLTLRFEQRPLHCGTAS